MKTTRTTAALVPILIDSTTRKPVAVGDTVTSFRGEPAVIEYFREPEHSASEGKISTSIGYHYVGVYGLEWINRTDR